MSHINILNIELLKSDITWRAIKPHLDDTMEKERSLSPKALNNLPMNKDHKQKLRQHWQRLHEDFRV
jgi:serine/threonine-protein kinase HipA